LNQIKNNSVTPIVVEKASLSAELEKLSSLHDKGVLTDDEFQSAKNKLLGL
jgi:hypothetical protein